MSEQQGSKTLKAIEQLFSSGSVILFACAPTRRYPLLWTSDSTKGILGFSSSYFLENEHGWSDRIHPDDTDQVRESFKKVVDQGKRGAHEYRFKNKSGAYIWLRDEIKWVPAANSDGPVIYGSSINITNRKKEEERNNQLKAHKKRRTKELKQEVLRRKKVEAELQRRLSYEKAIAQCSSLLLEGTGRDVLNKSLRVLLETTGADRVYLYKNKQKKDGLYVELKGEVYADDIKQKNIDREGDFKYSEASWWYNQLSNQKVAQVQIDDAPDQMRPILAQQQVQSVLAIPIMIDQQWDGYIGFADMQEPRYWDEKDISLLKTAADILASFKKRRQTQRSLIRQRDYTRTILNSLPGICILINEELEIVQWNRHAEQLMGYGKEELNQASVFEFVADEYHTTLRNSIILMQQQENAGEELLLLTKDGQKIPYFWNGQQITLNENVYYLCTGLDISRRKKAEQELRDEKRFNESLIESLPGIFYMVDDERRFCRYNQNFLDQLGYNAKELNNMTVADVFKEEESGQAVSVIREMHITDEVEAEAEVITKDGGMIPYHLTAKYFKRNDEDYLIGVGYDITKQEEARRKLRRSESLFRNLFLQSSAAIAMADEERKVLSVNKSFEQLFGYSEEEIKGKKLDQFIIGNLEAQKETYLSEDQNIPHSFQKETQRKTKDGSIIDVYVAGIPVYLDDNRVVGFGMYIDISEQKKYAEEIHASLVEKRVLLQEIHHRVKNNLAVISGLLQLQMYDTDNQEVKEMLQESENRIQTMALIHEKLYKSASLSRIALMPYIKELVKAIQSTAGARKQITITFDIDDVELTINKAVPFALLVNEAVTNAFKHAFRGRKQGEITIEITGIDGVIHARIADDGCGLPTDLSLDNANSLGMTLIRNFMEQLEADWTISTEGGTTISFSFNRRLSHRSAAAEFIES